MFFHVLPGTPNARIKHPHVGIVAFCRKFSEKTGKSSRAHAGQQKICFDEFGRGVRFSGNFVFFEVGGYHGRPRSLTCDDY